MSELRAKWDAWNQQGGPNYPPTKVVQFCFRKCSAHVRRQTRALDLGCGTGVNAWFLAREGFNVVATDISSVGIARTRDRLSHSGLKAVTRVEGAESVAEPDASVGLVICVGVSESAGPVVAARAVAEVSRILRPGGQALVLFAANDDMRVGAATPYDLYGFTRAEVDAMFAGQFAQTHVDRYITTYNGGQQVQSEWLVTCQR
ncbi:class I SAM-dependent methyltransferase [Pseudorhodoplanes sp.]|uniref:class I SAM-dependent methyltransferase n=1 Tax=Pseudorhodoplanes sp. TaxID=1934341 RepID=UPI0039C97B91